jgi:hypothetical protein
MGFSPKYSFYIRSPQWRKKASHFRTMTGGRCVLLPWLASTDAHHLTYRHLESEKYLRDCVPLSRNAHDWVHKGFIGQWLWTDIKTRRPFMNFGIRVMAIGVTVYAAIAGKRKVGKPRHKA